MKKFFPWFMFFFLFSDLNAQTNFQLPSIKEYSIKGKDTINATRISLGLGVVTPLGSGTYRPILSVNSNIHIYKILYFNAGFDCYSEPKYAKVTIFAPYIGPNIGINFLRINLLFLGEAVYIFTIYH